MVREKQSHIQPWDEIEKEDSGDECVLGGNEVDDQQPDAGNGLPQAEPVRSEQFVADQVILGPAERFQSHTQNEHAAINAVTAPRQVCHSGSIKCDHDPDAKPKEQRHDENLAKHEDAVETFGPLRNHGYGSRIVERVRDGSAPSTRAKLGPDI
jgi:hypothetical protein